MTAYLIDTNIIAYLADAESPFHETVKAHFYSLADNDVISISILTLYELQYSLAKADNSDVSDSIIRTKEWVCDSLSILSLNETSAQIFGQLKKHYAQYYGVKRDALNKSTVDLIIASSALEADQILVSNDAVFAKIQQVWPQLKHQNWAL